MCVISTNEPEVRCKICVIDRFSMKASENDRCHVKVFSFTIFAPIVANPRMQTGIMTWQSSQVKEDDRRLILAGMNDINDRSALHSHISRFTRSQFTIRKTQNFNLLVCQAFYSSSVFRLEQTEKHT